MKRKGFTVAFDFTWSGKVKLERGKHCSCLIFLFVVVWFIDDSLVEYIKKIKEKPIGKINLN